MKRYTHLLFDHDGVLVDTEPLYFQATQACVARLGVDLQLSDYLVLMAEGKNAWELAQQVGASEDDITRERQRRNSLYRELLDSESIEIEGVEEALTKLARHYRMAVVTTALAEDFKFIHRNRKIVSFFDFVITRESYENSKPDPDPYLAALETFGIGPRTALAVEDSQRGLRAAITAGLDCVVVYNAFTAAQDLTQATYRVKQITELPQLLEIS